MRKFSLAIFLFFLINYAYCQVLETDSLALIDILNNIPDGEHYSGWDVGNPVKTWKGVTLNSRGTRVISLSDHPNGSQDMIPFVMLLPSLANLTALDTLDLRRFGGDLSVLENVTNIKYIDLENMSSHVSEPQIIPNLTKLKKLTYLNLFGNNLTGSIPDFGSWDLPLLKKIVISYNQLEGQIPKLYNLPNLEYIDVSSNNLSGEIPDLSGLTSLQTFAAHNCGLTGGFSISASQKLSIIDISDNKLSGRLNFEPFYGRNMYRFDISNNNFWGDLDLINYKFSSTFMMISGNRFNLSSIENIMYGPIASTTFNYNPQDFFNLKQVGNYLIADSAGGDITKNTYIWSLNGNEIATVVGDNKLNITQAGRYYVDVISEIVSNFTMSSNEFIVAESALPITINSFTVSASKLTNTLIWSTGAEFNSSGFYIEKSLDGIKFNKIGFQAAKRSNSDYQFIDNSPYKTTYYRLKMVDNNGKFEYSEVRLVENNGIDCKLSISPNPATDQIKVRNSTGAIRIFNVIGKLVFTISSNTGITNIYVDKLPSGIYYLKDGSGNSTKFIKK